MRKILNKYESLLQNNFSIYSFICAVCVSLLLTITGCNKRLEYYGYSFQDNDNLDRILSQIIPAKSNELDVLNLLGSPTFLGEFSPRTFFYTQIKVNRNTVTGGGRINYIRTLAIEFTPETRIVTRLWIEEIPKVRNLPYLKSHTILKGNTPSIFQQIIGNLGKFNKPQNRYDNNL